MSLLDRPGGATELLQARVLEQMQSQKPVEPVNVEEKLAVEEPQAKQTPAEKLEPPQAVPETSLSMPEAQTLETLPNSEIDRLCAERLPKFDRRWGRDTKISKLLEAGISGPIPEPPPSPSLARPEG